MELLTGSGLVLKRADKIILDNIGFSLERGQLLGLMGPNGAGKSTLIKAVAGLLPLAAGDIQLGGKSLESHKPQEIAKKVAYLPQGHEVHWDMTVENLVMLGRLPHLPAFGKPSAKDWRIVHQALQDCDVVGFAQRRINTLSGGEKARVLLARALAVQPVVLLADEPLAGLDPGHQLEIIGFLRQLAEAGMGVVMVIHDLSLAARFCHRLVLLGEGRILQQGRVDDVMTAKNIEQCFNIKALTGRMQDIPFVLPIKSMNG